MEENMMDYGNKVSRTEKGHFIVQKQNLGKKEFG